MPRPLVATVLPSAVAANLQVARARAPGAQVLAVVKANAYGHGIARVLPGLDGADGLALLELDAAVRLRESGYLRPIVLLEGCFAAGELAEAGARRLSLVVHNAEQLEWIARHPAERMAHPFEAYVKVNSGMNRLGFRPEEVPAAVERLVRSGRARIAGIMTHFARADEADGIAEQSSRFHALCETLPGGPYPRSLANSAALLRDGPAGGEKVRPGIMLYGATPYAAGTGAELGLRPAMLLSSELIALQQLRAGEGVGYGGVFRAAADMRVGIVACGYADGYPRQAPTGTPVAVCGRRTRLVGRVSMDMMAVDLEGIPEARTGSPVELWGEQISVDEVARAAGTIGYELLCAVAPRVAMRVEARANDIESLGLGVEACI